MGAFLCVVTSPRCDLELGNTWEVQTKDLRLPKITAKVEGKGPMRSIYVYICTSRIIFVYYICTCKMIHFSKADSRVLDLEDSKIGCSRCLRMKCFPTEKARLVSDLVFAEGTDHRCFLNNSY